MNPGGARKVNKMMMIDKCIHFIFAKWFFCFIDKLLICLKSNKDHLHI
jgi:hypothetical protein